MKIRKIGHCCLLIKIGELTLLTDPGAFSVAQNTILEIDVVLITHEHADHFHIESLREILKNNPQATVITNSGVGKQLAEAGIRHVLLEGRGLIEIKDVSLEAFDGKHEELYEEIGQVQNTGYLIGGELFYPGDSFFDPEKPIKILALLVAGPWCKLPDAIRYALRVKPAKVFPIHDGMIRPDMVGPAHRIPEQVLRKNNIAFFSMVEGTELDF
jgi:L-ascorbate metabolism protein UlaG (beta-lactamase superfamily)